MRPVVGGDATSGVDVRQVGVDVSRTKLVILCQMVLEIYECLTLGGTNDDDERLRRKQAINGAKTPYWCLAQKSFKASSFVVSEAIQLH